MQSCVVPSNKRKRDSSPSSPCDDSVVRFEMEISVFYSSAITGKHGASIKIIQTNSGASISIKRHDNPVIVKYVLVGSSNAIKTAHDLIAILISVANYEYAAGHYDPFPDKYDPWGSFEDVLGRAASSSSIPSTSYSSLLSGGKVPYAPPQFASAPINSSTQWIIARSPFLPPFEKWVRAPLPRAFLTLSLGLPPLPHDPTHAPLLMAPTLLDSHLLSKTNPPLSNRHLKFGNSPVRRERKPPGREERRLDATLFKKLTLHRLLPHNYSARLFPSRGDSFIHASIGITWVCVRGTSSVCVVTSSSSLNHLERQAADRDIYLAVDQFRQSLLNVLVSEVEDVEDIVGSSKPFGFVSVCDIEACGGQINLADAEALVESLQYELSPKSALTYDETVMMAIWGFSKLHGYMLEACELRVFVWEKADGIGKELQQYKRDWGVEEIC